MFCDGVNDLVSCDLLRPKASYVCLLTREVTKFQYILKVEMMKKWSSFCRVFYAMDTYMHFDFVFKTVHQNFDQKKNNFCQERPLGRYTKVVSTEKF